MLWENEDRFGTIKQLQKEFKERLYGKQDEPMLQNGFYWVKLLNQNDWTIAERIVVDGISRFRCRFKTDILLYADDLDIIGDYIDYPVCPICNGSGLPNGVSGYKCTCS